MSWPTVALAEAADVIRGVTFSKEDAFDAPGPGLHPVLRAGNIGDELTINDDLVFVDESFVSEIQRLKPNDIVVCMSSGSASVLGKSAMLEVDWNGSFGAFLATVRPRPNVVVPRFLAQFLRTAEFRTWASASSGIGIKNIRASDLKAYEIPLPPLEEQQRIAGILDQADALRRLRTRALDRLNTLGQAIFHEMFGTFQDDFGQWPVRQLESLVVDAQIGAVRGAKEMGNDKPFEYLRMDSIDMEGGLKTEGLKRVNASPGDLSKYGLRPGDLLFNTRNSKELVGKTAVVREPFEGIYNNNILRIRVGDNYTADFLDAVLRTRRGQALLDAIKSGTTSVFAIYQRSLMALEVPVPPANLQHQYSSRMREIFAEKRQQIASLEQLSSLFTSVQHRAFRGEL